MKRLFLSLLAVIAAVSAMTAQPAVGKLSIIPRVGVSLSSMSSGGVNLGDAAQGSSSGGGLRSKAGLTAGADIDWQAGRQVSLSIGAYYTQQGCRYGNSTFEVAGSNPKQYYGISDNTVQLSTVNVPVLVNYYIAPGLAVKTGVQVELPFSAKSKYTYTVYTEKEGDTPIVESPKQAERKINDTMKSAGFSIPVGLSFEYMNVVVDARYNVGLTKVQKNEYGTDTKNRVFLFTAGYRFTL